MECSEKLVWNDYTRESLKRIQIDAPDEDVRRKVLANWDAVAKPLEGMGKFETLTAQIGAVLGTDIIDISQKAVLILCADNGIVEEGVSQSGQEVTAAVAKSMAKKQSAVCKMAKAVGAKTIPVDIGINGEERIPGVIDRKIRRGTRNFRNEPAMTEEEAVRAISVGIDLVWEAKKEGYRILAAGELGIGNTTTSSALAAVLLACTAEEVTGRGAGLDDAGLLRKRQIISEALKTYELNRTNPVGALAAVGGLDIAGLAGVCIGGALYHVPVVLDGLISAVAALLAEKIVPGTKAYLLASHKGKEPAVEKLLKELGLMPVIDADMALGEGTGAVMMLSLLETALQVYCDRTTFSDIRIEQYKRYTE